jgi:hypothetical protein
MDMQRERYYQPQIRRQQHSQADTTTNNHHQQQQAISIADELANISLGDLFQT